MPSITTQAASILTSDQISALLNSGVVYTIIPTTPQPSFIVITQNGPVRAPVGYVPPENLSDATFNGLPIAGIQTPHVATLDQFLNFGQEWVYTQEDAPTVRPTSNPPTPVASPLNPPPQQATITYAPSASIATLKRATAVSQMYTIFPDTFQNNILYYIGISGSLFSETYTITNITTNTSLELTVQVPSYIDATIAPNTILPGQQAIITTKYNVEAAISKFQADKQTQFTDKLQWFITPLDVTGPVYIPIN